MLLDQDHTIAWSRLLVMHINRRSYQQNYINNRGRSLSVVWQYTRFGVLARVHVNRKIVSFVFFVCLVFFVPFVSGRIVVKEVG